MDASASEPIAVFDCAVDRMFRRVLCPTPTLLLPVSLGLVVPSILSVPIEMFDAPVCDWTLELNPIAMLFVVVVRLCSAAVPIAMFWLAVVEL